MLDGLELEILGENVGKLPSVQTIIERLFEQTDALD